MRGVSSRTRGGALVVVLLGMLGGCITSGRLDTVDAGRTRVYEPGVPNFDMEAVATGEDGETRINVYAGIPPLSLVFIRQGDVYEAIYELRVSVEDEDAERVVARELVEDTLRFAAFAATQTLEAYVHTVRLPVPPGRYRVEVTLEDAESREEVTRRQQVQVAAPGSGAALSRIRLEAYRRGEEQAQPELALHLPSSLDSLRAVVELYRARGIDTLDVLLRLLRVQSDTSVATPPFWFTPSTGSTRYRGAFYGQTDTVLTARQRLVRPGAATIEFMLPRLDPGMYLLSVTGRAPNEADVPEQLEQERVLSVKGPSFPRITDIDQMTSALEYIATQDELEHIREGATPQERRRRFDAFWGELIADRQQATRLIEEYFSRVEAANLFYTSYKAGWKTDRGMVFIVMGPPLYIDGRADGERWYYSYRDQDPEYTFFFHRVRSQGRLDAFDHYVLERGTYYETRWRRAVERWRDGRVL